jgi:hypothetical protein
MKLLGETKVMLPWFDTDGNKNWSVLTFKGDVDHRRVRREIRKFVLHNFKRRVSNRWIDEMAVINPQDAEVQPRIVTDEEVEAFIQRMRYEENEDGAHPDSSGTPAQEAEVPLCTMQD